MSSTYTYSADLTALQGIAVGIGASGVTSAQQTSLVTLWMEAEAHDGLTSYVYALVHDVVANGDAIGTTQAAFNTLLDQWFLGSADPTPLAGATMASTPNAPLFAADMSTAYEHIDQGYYNGDCWLVAALDETSAVDPTALTSMLWENTNGTYGVRFCSPTGYVYVTVNNDLMTNKEGTFSTDGTVWAGLLEKAFVEAQGDGTIFPMEYGATDGNNYATVSNGGWDEMLLAITGRATSYYYLNSMFSLEAGGSVYNKILSDLNGGIPVLFDSNTNTSYGLVSNHMFAVIGIDQTTGDYILYNPWGTVETTTAQFEVSAAQLYQLYQSHTGDEFLASDGASYFAESAVCHLAGTRILTPSGERAIEALRVGDAVVTRFGGVQRVKWVGVQHYAGRFIARNREKLPVRMAPGALGDGLPRRALYVSPAHSLLLDGVLVLARDLVNGVTITQDPPPAIVSYYNIELAAHDCVLAEGSWSETYADCGELRGCFHNAASYWALYPHETAPAEPMLCAPRPRAGAAFVTTLARVVSLAEAQSAPGPTQGYVELVGDEVVGWAFDPRNPDLPVRLHVYVGEALIGFGFALEDRPDVREAGFGAGRCGFRCALPLGADPASITVRRAATGEALPRVAALAA